MKIYKYTRVYHMEAGTSKPLSVREQIPNSIQKLITTTTIHPFNGLFSRTTCLSQYQNGKTRLDLNVARDDGV